MTVVSAVGARTLHQPLGVGPEERETRSRPATRVGVAACAAVGVLLVALAFRLAANDGPAVGYSALFWLGVLAGLAPAGAQLLGRRTTRSDRLWALATVAVITGVPRFLRAATPLFPDEFASLRATLDVVAGSAVAPVHAAGGLVPGTDGLPGLPVVVGTIVSLTGWSVPVAAAALMFLTHLLGLVAIYRLAESLLEDSSHAGAAALLWAANPLSLYGGLRFTSATVAVPLAIVGLMLAASASASDAARRRRNLAAASLVVLGVALTDLMVASLLAGVVTVVAVVAAVRERHRPVQLSVVDGTVQHRLLGPEEHVRLWALLAAVTVSVTTALVAVVAVRGGAFMTEAWFAPRGLFGTPSRAPGVEAVLAVLATVVLLALCIDRAWALWSDPRPYSGGVMVLSLGGLVYFLGVPAGLMLPASAPLRGAWLLTYVGVPLLAAPPLVRGLAAARQLAETVWHRTAVAPAAALVLAVVLLGSTATGEGVGYRYPGPSEFGRDGRADVAEIRSLAEAFAADNGRVGVLTDRYTGPAFTAYSGSRMPRATALLPGNELMQGVDPTVPQLLGLVRRGYTHLVVDVGMAGVDPEDGFSFGPEDPGQGRMSRMTALRRLDRVPWVSRIAATEHYRVYRFDLAGAGLPLVEQADPWGVDYLPRDGSGPGPGLAASTSYAPAVAGNAQGLPGPVTGPPVGGIGAAGGGAASVSATGSGLPSQVLGGGAGGVGGPGSPVARAGQPRGPQPGRPGGKPAVRPQPGGASKPPKGAGPGKPREPARPVEPAKPAEPDKPARPPKASKPSKPARSHEAPEPSKPARSHEASKPSKPARSHEAPERGRPAKKTPPGQARKANAAPPGRAKQAQTIPPGQERRAVRTEPSGRSTTTLAAGPGPGNERKVPGLSEGVHDPVTGDRPRRDAT